MGTCNPKPKFIMTVFNTIVSYHYCLIVCTSSSFARFNKQVLKTLPEKCYSRCFSNICQWRKINSSMSLSECLSKTMSKHQNYLWERSICFLLTQNLVFFRHSFRCENTDEKKLKKKICTMIITFYAKKSFKR